VFVAATITVLVLVTTLIAANAMRRKIVVKSNPPQEDRQIKNVQNGQNSGWRAMHNPEIQQDKSPDIIKDTKGEVSKYNAMTTNLGQEEKRPIYNKALNGDLAVKHGQCSKDGRLKDGRLTVSPPDGGFREVPPGELSQAAQLMFQQSPEGSDQPSSYRAVHYYKAGRSAGGGDYPDYPAPALSDYHHYSAASSASTLHTTSSLHRKPPPSSLTLSSSSETDAVLKTSSLRRTGLPLCDGINVNRCSLRTPLLEDDRESCV